jgi:protein-L-isoaspartate(D-aspartate) O-methyltransferase
MLEIVSYRNPVKVILGVILISSCICLPVEPVKADDLFQAERDKMIRLIEQDVLETSVYLKRSSLDTRVLDAMARVPRHEFVPYIVAIMTDLLDLKPHHKVLEIGTGSGYQAAVLAALDTQVWSIEIIEPLGQQAKTRLQRLGFDSVEVRIGDGYYGWPQHAPFDAIIVTAAANHIPPPLVKQLAVGGKMIIPVGSRFSTQELILITRVNQDELVTRLVLPVRFVPLTGGH